MVAAGQMGCPMTAGRIALDHVSVGAFLRALALGLRRPDSLRGRLIEALSARRGVVVSHAELIERLWGDDPDGGPLGAAKSLSVHVTHLRARGYPIRNAPWRGWYLP